MIKDFLMQEKDLESVFKFLTWFSSKLHQEMQDWMCLFSHRNVFNIFKLLMNCKLCGKV